MSGLRKVTELGFDVTGIAAVRAYPRADYRAMPAVEEGGGLRRDTAEKPGAGADGTAEQQRSGGVAEGSAKATRVEAEIRELKRRDQEVRRHEQAHLSAAGAYAHGGASFTYTVGPDGKRYATGGEVSIDVSPASTPEATIAKMQIVQRAAVAPANPSPQDRAVYAAAGRELVEARRALAEEQQREAPLGSSGGGTARLDLLA